MEKKISGRGGKPGNQNARKPTGETKAIIPCRIRAGILEAARASATAKGETLSALIERAIQRELEG